LASSQAFVPAFRKSRAGDPRFLVNTAASGALPWQHSVRSPAKSEKPLRRSQFAIDGSVLCAFLLPRVDILCHKNGPGLNVGIKFMEISESYLDQIQRFYETLSPHCQKSLKADRFASYKNLALSVHFSLFLRCFLL
jgi:hypothetical protein